MLSPQDQARRQRFIDERRQDLADGKPWAQVVFSNELEVWSTEEMLHAYSNPEIYIGGVSFEYLNENQFGTPGYADRRRKMAGVAMMRFQLISEGVRPSLVMQILHPALYKRLQEAVKSSQIPGFDIEMPEENLAKFHAIYEAHAQEVDEWTSMQAANRTGVRSGPFPSPEMTASSAHANRRIRLEQIDRLFVDLHKWENMAKLLDGEVERLKKELHGAGKEISDLKKELEARAAEPPAPTADVGKLLIDNNSGQPVAAFPIDSINRFLQKTGQEVTIVTRSQIIEENREEGLEVPMVTVETTGDERVVTEEYVAQEDLPPTSQITDIPRSQATSSRATIAVGSSSSSSTGSKKRKRSDEEAPPPTRMAPPGAIPAGMESSLDSSTDSEEKLRRYYEMINVSQGRHPLAGKAKIKGLPKKHAKQAPNVNDWEDPAHMIPTSAPTAKKIIFKADRLFEKPFTDEEIKTATGGQLAKMATKMRAIACPDMTGMSRGLTVPADIGESDTPSQCMVRFCAARNPLYSRQEHDDGLFSYFDKVTKAQLLREATLTEGPWNMRSSAEPVVINLGVGGYLDWEDCERRLVEEGFFGSIASRAMFSFDLEGYPPHHERKMSQEAKARSVALLHMAAPNGVLFQISVMHNGSEEQPDPNERAVPQAIKDLFADARLRRFGLGAAGDAIRLMDSGVVPKISSVVDMHNWTVLAFPQHGTAVKNIKTGKEFLARQLDSPVVYVKNNPVGKEIKEMHGRGWDFSKPFNQWLPGMARYNRYDHALSWVLLHQVALRFAELEEYKGELLRVEHYALAYVDGWMPRSRAAGLTEATARPFPDWFRQDLHEVVRGPGKVSEQPMKAWPFYYQEQRLFNTPAEVFSIMQQMAFTWPIDRDSMARRDFDRMDMEFRRVASSNRINDVAKAYYNNSRPGYNFPHVCELCGGADHRGINCRDEDLQKLKCSYCRQDGHVAKVCHQLHTRCEACKVRGHAKEDHDLDMLSLWNRFLVGRRLGWLTFRLAFGPYAWQAFSGSEAAPGMRVRPIENTHIEPPET